MEVPGKLRSDADSERAEKFYEQALLLVDCCRIPEAIRLLEQAIKIKPNCEIYRETLAFFQTSSQYFSGHLQTEHQGLSYANVARPKPNLSNGKENFSSYEWNEKKARVKENSSKTPWPPSASSSYYSGAYQQATIDNPWTSFVNRNSKWKKTHGSPIDGISEIEIPPVSDKFCTQSPSSKQDYKYSDYQVLKDEQRSTPSSQAIHKGGRSVEFAQENHVNASDDHCGCEKGNCPEDCYTNSENHDENVDDRFLEELCMARESATDDWAKYYDVLSSGLKEDMTCNQSNHNTHSNREYLDALDEITVTENHLGKDHSRSENAASMCSNNVCSKCGHLMGSGNPPSSPTKNRIHFVNGACISSSSLPNCTCSKLSKGCSQEKSAKLPLSSSQQEFYRNLRCYFGSGEVNSRKTRTKAENDESSAKSSDLPQKSSRSCGTCDTKVSSTTTKEPLNATSNEKVTESTQSGTKGETVHKRKNSKGHDSCEVTDGDVCSESWKMKAPLNAEVKSEKKSSGDERFQPTGSKQKARTRDKIRNKVKDPTKTEHVKSSKEEVLQSYNSQRRQPRVNDKSRTNHRGKANDTSRPGVQASETREKSSHKHKVKQTSQAEIDFTALFSSLYCTGVSVVSKCFQAFKSIMYYILLLVVLLFGFLIYCIWFAGCWLIRKVLHYIAVDRLFAAVRSKVSALPEWLRKRREARRKTSAQTYDLPKNGDAAIRHMLQNKDSDPYSVLGVPSDATDDDIRKQYRKLAVLIHPDKNSHSQADEAFKILANAFDILSDAEKRRDYDREAAWKRAEEREGSYSHPGNAEQFFADLGRKMQEMQNYLHCNQCDGKHRRYKTDRFVLTARFCSQCNTRHAGKEGDLWAESSFLGYKLHFYACMEGEVYDVTEWAACQGLGNYRLEPNPHTVHLKLKTRQSHPSGFNSRSEEEDFENFMRAFFGQFNASKDERYHRSNKQPKQRKRKKRR